MAIKIKMELRPKMMAIIALCVVSVCDSKKIIALQEEFDEIEKFPRLASILVVESEVVKGNLSWMELNRRLTTSEMDEKMFEEFDGINLVNGSVEVNDVLDLAESRRGRGGMDYEKTKKLLDELEGINIENRKDANAINDSFKTVESLLENPLETFTDELEYFFRKTSYFFDLLKRARTMQKGYEGDLTNVFHQIVLMGVYSREIGSKYGFDGFLSNWKSFIGHFEPLFLNLRKLEPTLGIVKTTEFINLEDKMKEFEVFRDDDTHEKLEVLVEKVRSLIDKWSGVQIKGSSDLSLFSVRDLLKPIPSQFNKFESYFQVLSKNLKEWRYKLKVRKWEATSSSDDLTSVREYLKKVSNFKRSIGNGSISDKFGNVKHCLNNFHDSFQHKNNSKSLQDELENILSITKEIISMFQTLKQIGNFTEYAKPYALMKDSDVQKLDVAEILESSKFEELKKFMISLERFTERDYEHPNGQFHKKIEEWNSSREKLLEPSKLTTLKKLDCLSNGSFDYSGIKKLIEISEKEDEEVWTYDLEELESVVDVMLASKKTSRQMKKKTSEVDWIGSEDENILRTFTMNREGLKDLMAGVKALEMVVDVQKAWNSWEGSDYPKVQKSWEIIDSQMKAFFKNITDIDSLIQSPSPHFETAELLDYIWNGYPGDSRILILRVLRKVVDFESNYLNITRDLGNMEKSVKWMKDWVKTLDKNNVETSTSSCTYHCHSSTYSSSKKTSESKDDTSTVLNVESSTQVTSQSELTSTSSQSLTSPDDV